MTVFCTETVSLGLYETIFDKHVGWYYDVNVFGLVEKSLNTYLHSIFRI